MHVVGVNDGCARPAETHAEGHTRDLDGRTCQHSTVGPGAARGRHRDRKQPRRIVEPGAPAALCRWVVVLLACVALTIGAGSAGVGGGRQRSPRWYPAARLHRPPAPRGGSRRPHGLTAATPDSRTGAVRPRRSTTPRNLGTTASPVPPATSSPARPTSGAWATRSSPSTPSRWATPTTTPRSLPGGSRGSTGGCAKTWAATACTR